MAKTIYINARVHGCVAVKLPSGKWGSMLHVDDDSTPVIYAAMTARADGIAGRKSSEDVKMSPPLVAWREDDGVKAVPDDWCRTDKAGNKIPLHEFMGTTGFGPETTVVDATEPLQEEPVEEPPVDEGWRNP